MVHFRNGILPTGRNIRNGSLRKDSLKTAHYNKKYYVLVQFDQLPDSAAKVAMAGAGLHLFDYVSDRTWLAALRDSFSIDELNRFAVSSVSRMPAAFKLHRRLQQDPANYIGGTDKLLAISYFGDISDQEVRKGIEATGVHIVPEKIQPPHMLFVSATGVSSLQKLAALPYVSYIAPQPMKSKTLNYDNRATHGADALAAPTTGRGLFGDGVVVGVGDDSDPYTHADFSGRLIERFASTVNDHGTHTSGTVGGGGIVNPRYQGMAPHATIVSQYFSDILSNASTYIQDYNMVLTSNSYTNYDYGCDNDGEYDGLSYYTDAQLYSNAYLLHNFASGNDGDYTCSPYTQQRFGTVKSGFQAAKNALTIGNIDNINNYVINGFSSAGPVNDGRLKPEVVAGGTNIFSTLPYNNYGEETGTSMSCPTVAGSLALVVQRYRQLHATANPPAILLKALACNTATDLGNPGPDYIFGFGSLNVKAAVESMEGVQYGFASVNTGSSVPATINVPANTRQLKVMLYWADYPAAPFTASALVNNLDLTVTDPASALHHPLVLNPAAAHVNDPAIEGVDNLNNIEQVVINNPSTGSYHVNIQGTSVPAGPQTFVLVWQYVKSNIDLLYPYGGENIVPNNWEVVRWNANDGGTTPFTVALSYDGGGTWTTLSNNVPGNSTNYFWWVPTNSPYTNQGIIRVTRNGTGAFVQSSLPFTIMNQPVVTIANPCQGYARLTWSPVPYATGYDIMKLTGSTMQKVAVAIDTTFLLGSLNRDSTYWLAVRAVNGSTPGQRSIAVNITPAGPANGVCALSALDNDYTVDSLIGPGSGRMYTSSVLGTGVPVKIEIKNLGTIPSGSTFTMSYSINGGAPVTETAPVVIPGGGAYDYTFTNKPDLSAAGAYTLQTWVSYPGDPQHGNDTVTTMVKQLSNAPITLNPSYTESFESSAAGTYYSPARGFTGLDRVDFFASNGNGRARTFVNTGLAHTGNRYITLDQTHASTVTSADSLITTFNLGAYTSSDQIWLDFYYRNQGNDSTRGANLVWLRGNDQSGWLPVYTLDTTADNIGVYQPSAHIDVTGILKNASPPQSVSTSFQIKFGEEGYTSANSVTPDGTLDDGYIFDDIKLSLSANDIGISSLVSPAIANTCALSGTQAITIKVKNYGNSTASNVPVTWSVNGTTGPVETITSIPAHDSVLYTFSQTADMSGYGSYTITAWLHSSGDTYSANDTLTPVTIHTQPLISAFPYLEGFENSDGHWYTGGLNSSWQWGAPSGTVINKAANGNNCWKTNLSGDYNNSEQSYLYSPCFDLSGLTSPVLSFSHVFQTEDDCDCDYHWVEYSTDGVSWTKLGATGSGVNWYDNAIRQAWQLSDTSWHVSSFDIPVNAPKVSFRIAMKSDEATTYEGVGIDDIHVFDKAAIYAGPTLVSGMVQPVSGTAWVDFDAGGHRVASINANGQDLGATTVKVYINTAPVRNDGARYYLDRNIVIQPSNKPISDVSVRYYFLDSEVDTLVHATGCTGCTTIANAYQAGVTQYSSSVAAEEDGSLANNISGIYTFHQPHQEVTVIPYDNGYYAEYTVSGFSEFWISNSGPSPNIPLPLNLLNFTAVKSGNDALLQWSTSQDPQLNRFVIEKSTDGTVFSPLDSTKAITDNDSTHFYQYTDTHLQSGSNYYRLRMIDTDAQFTLSPVRTVNEAGTAMISIYPNPVQNGTLYINSSVNCRHIRLTDVSGKILLDRETQGYQQTIPMENIARGIYLLIVNTDTGATVQKVFVK